MSQNNKITDIHTHILPEVDDGSKSFEESLEILDMEYRQGVRRIMLTPHYVSGESSYEYSRLYDLQSKLQENIGSDIALYLGNEILYSDDTVQGLREGRIQSLNCTRYVLVEYMPNIEVSRIFSSVADLERAGWIPVIAHVERYHRMIDKKDAIVELLRQGVYLQMNTNSLVGSRFDRRVRICRRMIKEGWISFLATDTHGSRYRPPEWNGALEWMDRQLGQKEIHELLWDNADRLIQGMEI